MIWYPDFCPSGGCALEIEPDWSAAKRFVRICPHHEAVRSQHALDDQGLFMAILQSSRAKEAARYAAKTQLGLDKNHPPLPYTVATDGGFIIHTDVPSASAARVAARIAARNAAAEINRPPGTSTVEVD